ncbi:MAG: hypothetical protein PHY47_28595 [Lachnospiraceae bacterium]|nr:hypothetical protein [Lachnospiraceae bacterium]
MSDDFYRALTPSFRAEINKSIDDNISELKTCQNNAFVNMQMAGQEALKNLINALPDGYLVPMKRRER